MFETLPFHPSFSFIAAIQPFSVSPHLSIALPMYHFLARWEVINDRVLQIRRQIVLMKLPPVANVVRVPANTELCRITGGFWQFADQFTES